MEHGDEAGQRVELRLRSRTRPSSFELQGDVEDELERTWLWQNVPYDEGASIKDVDICAILDFRGTGTDL